MLALVTVGTAASVIGRLLAGWRRAFAIGAAALTAFAGIAVLFAPVLRRLAPDPPVERRAGIMGAFAYGIFFSVATITTSAGPLMLLLTITAAVGRPLYGALLSTAYAVGRGAPFLMLALFSARFQDWLASIERLRRPFEVISGAALIAVAGYFVRIAAAGY